MSKRKDSIAKPVLSKMTILAIVIVGLIVGYLITKLGIENSYNKQSSKDQVVLKNIATSPSGKYKVRSVDGTGYGKLEIITPTNPIELSQLPTIDQSESTIDSKNFAWSKDEDIFVFTNLYQKETGDSGWIYFFSSSTGNLIAKHDLGSGSFYGINKNQAFYPILSPDKKYIVVQTDLIHSFSIFDITGNFIAKVPTIYKSVDLFSDAMYQLDGGTYSPFLEYSWNQNNISLNYNFRASTQNQKKVIHTLNLTTYLP